MNNVGAHLVAWSNNEKEIHDKLKKIIAHGIYGRISSCVYCDANLEIIDAVRMPRSRLRRIYE